MANKWLAAPMANKWPVANSQIIVGMVPTSAESHVYKVEENDNVTKFDSLYYFRSRKN